MSLRLLPLLSAFLASYARVDALALKESSSDPFPRINSAMAGFCGSATANDPELGMLYGGDAPCRMGTLAFAVAFSSCTSSHQGESIDGLVDCIGSCASKDLCVNACAHGPTSCEPTCTKLATCVQQQVAPGKITGPISMESNMKRCLGLDTDNEIDVLVQLQQHLQRHGSNQTADRATTACGCVRSSDLQGRKVHLGCDRHGGEPRAGGNPYCVLDGGMECSGAQPSEEFPGLYWQGCHAPDYSIFPAGCELRVEKPYNEKLQELHRVHKFPAVEHVTEAIRPPSNVQALHAQTISGSTYSDSGGLETLRKHLVEWSTTLSPSWHARYSNRFADPTTTTTTMALPPPLAPAAAPPPMPPPPKTKVVVFAPAPAPPEPLPMLPFMMAPAPQEIFEPMYEPIEPPYTNFPAVNASNVTNATNVTELYWFWPAPAPASAPAAAGLAPAPASP